MPNMSYCRFQNTRMDFAECADVLEDLIDLSTSTPLSPEELEAAKGLLKKAIKMVAAFADDVGGELDFDNLEDEVDKRMDSYNTEAYEASELDSEEV